MLKIIHFDQKKIFYKYNYSTSTHLILFASIQTFAVLMGREPRKLCELAPPKNIDNSLE